MPEQTDAERQQWLEWRNHDTATGHGNNALALLAILPPSSDEEHDTVALRIRERVRATVELHAELLDASRKYLAATEAETALRSRRSSQAEKNAAYAETRRTREHLHTLVL